jgi:glycosyltransferase involved in cell wall biosynthesis
MTEPEVSIVVPVYNERDNLEPLVREISAALGARAYEIVLVDDGSTDGSAEIIESMAAANERLRAIYFRRNAGQSAAFDAGFRAARGAIVVTLDADLQNDPKDIVPMIERLDEGFDLVAGWRKARKDPFFSRTVPSKLGNWFIRRVTGTRLHDMGCSLRVCRREITDELRVYGESHRFLSVMAEHVGARTTELVVNHRPRSAGRSKYGLSRAYKVLFDLFTVWYMRGYQTKPIYVFGLISVLLFAFACASSAYVLYEKYALGTWVHRNPLFILSMIAALMTVQFLFMGLLSETLMRTYFESQGRPPYVVAKHPPRKPRG